MNVWGEEERRIGVKEKKGTCPREHSQGAVMKFAGIEARTLSPPVRSKRIAPSSGGNFLA